MSEQDVSPLAYEFDPDQVPDGWPLEFVSAYEHATIVKKWTNTYAQLVAALEAITTHTGCSDPDCCKLAIEQEDARNLCRVALLAAKVRP